MWRCKLGDKRESSVSVSVGVRGGEEKSGGVFLREGKETSRRWKVCTWCARGRASMAIWHVQC